MDRLFVLSEDDRYRLLSLIEERREGCSRAAWSAGVAGDMDARERALEDARPWERLGDVLRAGIRDEVVAAMADAVRERLPETKRAEQYAIRQEKAGLPMPFGVQEEVLSCESALRILSRLLPA